MKNWSDLCQNGCCLPAYTQEWFALEGQVTNTDYSRRCKKPHKRRIHICGIYLQFCTYGNPPFAVGNVLRSQWEQQRFLFQLHFPQCPPVRYYTGHMIPKCHAQGAVYCRQWSSFKFHQVTTTCFNLFYQFYQLQETSQYIILRPNHNPPSWVTLSNVVH